MEWCVGANDTKKNPFKGFIDDVRIYGNIKTSCIFSLVTELSKSRSSDENLYIDKILIHSKDVLSSVLLELRTYCNKNEMLIKDAADKKCSLTRTNFQEESKLIEILALMCQNDICFSLLEPTDFDTILRMLQIFSNMLDMRIQESSTDLALSKCQVAIESAHPLADHSGSTDVVLSVASDIGALAPQHLRQHMAIWFDPMSSCDDSRDFVQFYLRKECTPESRVGYLQYRGDVNENNYPSVDNPLNVAADTVYVRMILGSKNSHSWGWRIFAAPIKRLSEVALSQVSQVDCYDVVASCVQNKPHICLESEHPYSANLSVSEKVKFSSSASRLEVYFTNESFIEEGFDHVTFYKDESRMDFWGNAEYFGAPGMNLPTKAKPLIIEAPSFFFTFVSDSCTEAWGYKIIVREKSDDAADHIVNELDTLENISSLLVKLAASTSSNKTAFVDAVLKFSTNSQVEGISPLIDLLTNDHLSARIVQNIASALYTMASDPRTLKVILRYFSREKINEKTLHWLTSILSHLSSEKDWLKNDIYATFYNLHPNEHDVIRPFLVSIPMASSILVSFDPITDLKTSIFKIFGYGFNYRLQDTSKVLPVSGSKFSVSFQSKVNGGYKFNVCGRFDRIQLEPSFLMGRTFKRVGEKFLVDLSLRASDSWTLLAASRAIANIMSYSRSSFASEATKNLELHLRADFGLHLDPSLYENEPSKRHEYVVDTLYKVHRQSTYDNCFVHVLKFREDLIQASTKSAFSRLDMTGNAPAYFLALDMSRFGINSVIKKRLHMEITITNSSPRLAVGIRLGKAINVNNAAEIDFKDVLSNPDNCFYMISSTKHQFEIEKDADRSFFTYVSDQSLVKNIGFAKGDIITIVIDMAMHSLLFLVNGVVVIDFVVSSSLSKRLWSEGVSPFMFISSGSVNWNFGHQDTIYCNTLDISSESFLQAFQGPAPNNLHMRSKWNTLNWYLISQNDRFWRSFDAKTDALLFLSKQAVDAESRQLIGNINRQIARGLYAVTETIVTKNVVALLIKLAKDDDMVSTAKWSVLALLNVLKLKNTSADMMSFAEAIVADSEVMLRIVALVDAALIGCDQIVASLFRDDAFSLNLIESYAVGNNAFPSESGVVYDSPHPMKPGTMSTIAIDLPGADCISIVFNRPTSMSYEMKIKIFSEDPGSDCVNSASECLATFDYYNPVPMDDNFPFMGPLGKSQLWISCINESFCEIAYGWRLIARAAVSITARAKTSPFEDKLLWQFFFAHNPEMAVYESINHPCTAEDKQEFSVNVGSILNCSDVSIVFDWRTCTLLDEGILYFYADENHTELLAEYSGDNSHWPSVYEPLVVESTHFYVKFICNTSRVIADAVANGEESSFIKGSSVQCNSKGCFHNAEIRSVRSSGNFDVIYDDGETGENIPLSMLRMRPSVKDVYESNEDTWGFRFYVTPKSVGVLEKWAGEYGQFVETSHPCIQEFSHRCDWTDVAGIRLAFHPKNCNVELLDPDTMTLIGTYTHAALKGHGISNPLVLYKRSKVLIRGKFGCCSCSDWGLAIALRPIFPDEEVSFQPTSEQYFKQYDDNLAILTLLLKNSFYNSAPTGENMQRVLSFDRYNPLDVNDTMEVLNNRQTITFPGAHKIKLKYFGSAKLDPHSIHISVKDDNEKENIVLKGDISPDWDASYETDSVSYRLDSGTRNRCKGFKWEGPFIMEIIPDYLWKGGPKYPEFEETTFQVFLSFAVNENERPYGTWAGLCLVNYLRTPETFHLMSTKFGNKWIAYLLKSKDLKVRVAVAQCFLNWVPTKERVVNYLYRVALENLDTFMKFSSGSDLQLRRLSLLILQYLLNSQKSTTEALLLECLHNSSKAVQMCALTELLKIAGDVTIVEKLIDCNAIGLIKFSLSTVASNNDTDIVFLCAELLSKLLVNGIAISEFLKGQTIDGVELPEGIRMLRDCTQFSKNPIAVTRILSKVLKMHKTCNEETLFGAKHSDNLPVSIGVQNVINIVNHPVLISDTNRECSFWKTTVQRSDSTNVELSSNNTIKYIEEGIIVSAKHASNASCSMYSMWLRPESVGASHSHGLPILVRSDPHYAITNDGEKAAVFSMNSVAYTGRKYVEITFDTPSTITVFWSSANIHDVSFSVKRPWARNLFNFGVCANPALNNLFLEWTGFDNGSKPPSRNSTIFTRNSDVIGMLIDIESKKIHFTVNGIAISGLTYSADNIGELYENSTDDSDIDFNEMWEHGFCPTISLPHMASATINAGLSPFKFIPDGYEGLDSPESLSPGVLSVLSETGDDGKMPAKWMPPTDTMFTRALGGSVQHDRLVLTLLPSLRVALGISGLSTVSTGFEHKEPDVVLSTTNAIWINQWSHLTIFVTSDNEVQFHINGILDSTHKVPFDAEENKLNAIMTPFGIGMRPRYFNVDKEGSLWIENMLFSPHVELPAHEKSHFMLSLSRKLAELTVSAHKKLLISVRPQIATSNTLVGYAYEISKGHANSTGEDIEVALSVFFEILTSEQSYDSNSMRRFISDLLVVAMSGLQGSRVHDEDLPPTESAASLKQKTEVKIETSMARMLAEISSTVYGKAEMIKMGGIPVLLALCKEHTHFWLELAICNLYLSHKEKAAMISENFVSEDMLVDGTYFSKPVQPFSVDPLNPYAWRKLPAAIYPMDQK